MSAEKSPNGSLKQDPGEFGWRRFLGRPLFLYVLFLLLAVLPVFLFSRSARQVLRQQTEKQVLQESQQVASLAALLVQEHFHQAEAFLHAYAMRYRFREEWARRDLRKVTVHLEQAYRLRPDFAFFSIYEVDGTLRATYPPDPGVVNRNFAFRDWYQGVSREWKPYVSEVYQTAVAPNQLVVAVAVPIKDEQDRPIGILMAPYALDTISRWLREVHAQGSWALWVVDQNGQLLAHPNIDVFQPPVSVAEFEPVRRVREGQRGAGVFRRGEEEAFVAYVPVAGYRWGMVVEQPAGMVREAVRAVERQLWVLRVVYAALALLFGGVLGSFYRQQRRAAEALKASEERTRLIVDRAHDAFIAINSEGLITEWNPQAESTFGWSRTEMVGRPLAETIIPPQHREAHRRGLERFLATGEGPVLGKRLEMTALHHNGHEFPVELTISAIPVQGSHLFTAFLHDISDRKRVEEERNRFFTLSLDLLCIAGFDGYFKRLNPAWEKTLGFTNQELSAKPYVEFVHPDDREATVAEGQKLATGAVTITFENRYLCKDGSYRWLWWTAVPVVEQQLIYAAAHDITERKRAEEVAAQLAAIVESSDDAIIGKTPEGLIVTWNPGAERIYGYRAEEVKGRCVSLLAPPERPDEVLTILEGIRHGEHVSHHETERMRKDGQRIYVSLSISPIKDGTGKIIGAATIARDITERKLAEELLRERTQELEATNKELEAFTYSVSHDLRAPLRQIDGFARMLTDELGTRREEKTQHYLERILGGTRQMGQLVDELLNLSRVGRQEVKRQATGLNTLLEEVLAELKPETDGRVIDWRIGPLPFVDCDPALMKQVLANLLSNAIKFTRPRPQAIIEVGQTTANNQPAVFVRDNGVGFSMKYVDKLFGIFQRLHRAADFEGTGVGLALVQRIIHKHGGRVWAEAELDKGATFFFSLEGDLNQGAETPTPRHRTEVEHGPAGSGDSPGRG